MFSKGQIGAKNNRWRLRVFFWGFTVPEELEKEVEKKNN